jgi:N6-L-threonylcarbamoyladenine synthase
MTPDQQRSQHHDGECERALEQTGLDQLIVAGGVGANKRLRARLTELLADRGGRASFPRLQFCTDNGAMIAYAGWARRSAGERQPDSRVRVTARWPLDELQPPGASAVSQG